MEVSALKVIELLKSSSVQNALRYVYNHPDSIFSSDDDDDF